MAPGGATEQTDSGPGRPDVRDRVAHRRSPEHRLAFLGAVPLILWDDGVVGRLGFLAPLPFAFSSEAALAWVALVAALSVLATLSPALRAAALTV